MNNYLRFTRASIGEEATEEEREYIRKLARDTYDESKDRRKNTNRSSVGGLIEEFGEKAVLETGYKDSRYRKPVIQQYQKFDCFGDEYEAPITVYADGVYDYQGLTKESLEAYLQGYEFEDIAWAAAGGILIRSEEVGMEDIAKQLVSEHRTYTIRPISKVQKKKE